MYLKQIVSDCWTPLWAADETVGEEHICKRFERVSCKITDYVAGTLRIIFSPKPNLKDRTRARGESAQGRQLVPARFRSLSGEVFTTCVESMSQADVSCSARQRVFQEALRKGNTAELHSLLRGMTNCEFNVNSFGPEGQTALHQSVIDGNLELVKLLVKFGADVRLANRDGWSALHMAAFGGHQDIALYLITRAKYSSGAL